MELFYVGTPSGHVYVCDNAKVLFRFAAHRDKLHFLGKSRVHAIILTLGTDHTDVTTKGSVKCWDISTPNSPEELSCIPLPDTIINDHGQISCVALSDDFAQLAIGLNKGVIYLLLGDFAAGAKTVNKQALRIESSDMVTNISFLKKQRGFFLFYTTPSCVGNFFVKDRNVESRVLDEYNGCEYRCADIDEKHGRLVVGMVQLDAVTLFEPLLRGPTWSFEGNKVILKCYNTHVIVVTLVRNQHLMSIYDVENKYIAYMKTYTMIDQILCEEDGVYVVSRNTR